MSPRRHLALGLFFLAVVGILGYYTLFKTDVQLFGERQRLTAFVENAGGLRKGSPVLYAGVRWGKVEEVVPDIERPREERVRIPGAEENEAPAEFREELLDAMKQKPPEQYREQVKRYYESLIQ